MVAKPSDWRLMGVVCGTREADPKVHSAENGVPGRVGRTRSGWRAEAVGQEMR